MFTAFGFVFPFLPLFIGELGVGDIQQVEVWSGISSFGQALVLSAFSPIWGAVADRRGRRLMVLRAAFGGGVVIGLMGLSQNIWEFMALRLVQGAMTGVVAAVTALATSFVPRTRRSGAGHHPDVVVRRQRRWTVNWGLCRRSRRVPPQLRH